MHIFSAAAAERCGKLAFLVWFWKRIYKYIYIKQRRMPPDSEAPEKS